MNLLSKILNSYQHIFPFSFCTSRKFYALQKTRGFMSGFDTKCRFTTLVCNSLNDFCIASMISSAISYVFSLMFRYRYPRAIVKHVQNRFQSLIDIITVKYSSAGIANLETKYAHFDNRSMFYGDEIKLKLMKVKKTCFTSFEKVLLREYLNTYAHLKDEDNIHMLIRNSIKKIYIAQRCYQIRKRLKSRVEIS